VEVIAGVTRRRLGGGISHVDADAVLNDFRHDLTQQYIILNLTPPVLIRAASLAEVHGLRGYDAVQLAAALEDHRLRLALGTQALTFVSADQQLNAAARVEGLLVEDPNAHP
jgi:predicted nucleic acid-binding protein